MNKANETTKLPFETVVETNEVRSNKRDEKLSHLLDLFQAGAITFQQYRQGTLSCQ